MKITIYELLGMVKDGKAPKNLKYNDDIYEYDYDEKNYAYFFIDHYRYLFNGDIMQILDDEVEILEEEKKIPEKINMKWDKDYYVLDEDNVKRYLNERDKIEINKINEIIDYLKSKGDE